MTTTKTLEAFKAAARAMSAAHYNLLRVWEEIDRENGPEREAVDKGYPFDASFDEVFCKIGAWIDDLDKIGKPSEPDPDAHAAALEREGNEIAERAEVEAEERHAGEDETDS